MAMGAAPARNIPEVLDRVLERYVADGQDSESFVDWVARVGKAQVRGWIEDLLAVPSFEADPSYYSDWGDPRVFGISDIGVGECAGEVVATTGFDLQASESEVFAAQARLEQGDVSGAAALAYRAMVLAALALNRSQDSALPDEPAQVVAEFRTRFYDTERFFDPYARGKFAQFLFRVHREVQSHATVSHAGALQRVVEAQLFVEAAFACHARSP
jgi:sulfite reductase (ferredoxin)